MKRTIFLCIVLAMLFAQQAGGTELSFVPSVGRGAKGVAFVAHGTRAALLLTRDGMAVRGDVPAPGRREWRTGCGGE